MFNRFRQKQTFFIRIWNYQLNNVPLQFKTYLLIIHGEGR